jgi:NAD(P)-dependent dehydrogenase (short-subunit alcohol dehydrogenase family)
MTEGPRGLCAQRVVIVTGAGRGIGREHAVELARQGANVVVNDLGTAIDGTGRSRDPAGEVVAHIRELGGDAVANNSDIATWAGAENVVATAVDTFGRLDAVVNNAGVVRDAVLVNMTESEFDTVVSVHLKGTFCVTRHAAAYWRERSKAGDVVDARVINTTSAAGLFGNPGQANYGAAKAGIVGFTQIAALELERYGVTVNAIAPAGRTRMTEKLFPSAPGDGFDRLDAANNAPLVAWLASSDSAGITGRVFELAGGTIRVLEGWRRGPLIDRPARWDPTELGPVVRDLVARAARPTLAHP